MDIENIEEARVLINNRNTLLDVLEKSQKWSSGHFVFTEHCGSHSDKIAVTCFPELQDRILNLIRLEVESIENKLKKL